MKILIGRDFDFDDINPEGWYAEIKEIGKCFGRTSHEALANLLLAMSSYHISPDIEGTEWNKVIKTYDKKGIDGFKIKRKDIGIPLKKSKKKKV